jgi:hypothetical protein
MSRKKTNRLTPEVEARVRRNMSSEGSSISTETGLEAARQIAQIAKGAKVKWALAGGLAMHLYGFTRATKDVDMIAAEPLLLEAKRKLTFGGECYQVKVGRRVVEVDWIVRADDKQEVYEAALKELGIIQVGKENWPIIIPEWLVILKHLAGRGKDELDLLWLLREPGLVDRKKVERLAKKLFGRFAYLLLQDLQSVYLQADLMRARDEQLE